MGGVEGGGEGELTWVGLPVLAGLIEGGYLFRGWRLLDCGLLFQ